MQLWRILTGGVFLAAVMASADEIPPIFLPAETILFQGDSITDGNRGRSADPNHILGHGYVFLIAAKYGATYPNLGLTFINRGISGNTLANLTDRWEPDTLALKPDVLSILVGINDIYFALGKGEDFSAEKFYEKYDLLLADTIKARPHVKLVICEPFILRVGMTAKDYPTWRKAVDDVGGAVAKLGEIYHAPVVHFQKVFDEAAGRAPADHWIWDGIHPTYSGHQLMADAWIKAYHDYYRLR